MITMNDLAKYFIDLPKLNRMIVDDNSPPLVPRPFPRWVIAGTNVQLMWSSSNGVGGNIVIRFKYNLIHAPIPDILESETISPDV